jgi:group I intron endonuclease
MGVIYKITNPKGLVYIGQTINFEARMRAYRGKSKVSQPRIKGSILKYGFENHKVEILCECHESQLNELERYYQDLYNVLDRKSGLNLRLTESFDRSGKLSEETKQKLRERDMPHLVGNQFRKGKPHSEEAKAKISRGGRGKQLGEKNAMYGMTGEKTPFYGKKHTPESLKKMSIAMKGKMSGEKNPMYGVRKFSYENSFYGKTHNTDTKRKMRERHSRSRKVVCIDTGVEYYSVAHAAEAIGMSKEKLRRRLDEKVKNNTTLRYK